MHLPFFSRRLSARRHAHSEIHPDEILLDARNLPDYNTHQFEGRLEKPISKAAFRGVILVIFLAGVIFAGRLWILQVRMGEAYSLRSESNHLRHSTIFAERGVIYDRAGAELAWNELLPGEDFARRRYATTSGIAHAVGYVKYPLKDTSGVYYEEHFAGMDGVEEYYNDELIGENGLKIIETDALGAVQSESVIAPPRDGDHLTLALDLRVNEHLFRSIRDLVKERGFEGGSGVIMDVHSGEILALASFPEYDPNIMTEGEDKGVIQSFLTDTTNPFLDRVVAGQYIPGSIMKPFIAMGALEEDIISPEKQILSIGAITIPNPYNPSLKTIFREWKPEGHGWVDMRRALAVSSDEYFYTIGGGYGDQQGMGIANIEKYVRAFGFGVATGVDLFGEKLGTIPNPKWKEEVFDGDPWRLGDTYNSSIGQYGFQVTPIQVVRAVAAFANGGTLVRPTILLDSARKGDVIPLPFDPEYFSIIKEGMRMGVTEGTASGLSLPSLKVAAKTGTAELGAAKEFVNSWVTGFFPYEQPRFAFAVLMEKGPYTNTVGATYIMRQVLEWMIENTPEYVQ